MAMDLEKLALLRTISTALPERELADVNPSSCPGFVKASGATRKSVGCWAEKCPAMHSSFKAKTHMVH
jgi:hypothetical protein